MLGTGAEVECRRSKECERGLRNRGRSRNKDSCCDVDATVDLTIGLEMGPPVCVELVPPARTSPVTHTIQPWTLGPPPVGGVTLGTGTTVDTGSTDAEPEPGG